jgi:hypothetical protein
MAEWLYKARDVAASGERRPGFEETRSFAADDRILCRSARTKDGHWIKHVREVELDDVVHMFFRQTASSRILAIGASASWTPRLPPRLRGATRSTPSPW